MEDAAKLEMRHWANFDHAYMRDFFVSQQSIMKFEEVQREVNAAIAERNAALEEKKHANAARDSALLQRDIAYAERHAALMDRDNALAEVAMIEEERLNSGSAAKMTQVVNIPVDRFPEGSNLLCSSTHINGMEINHIEGKLPQRRAKQPVKNSEEENSRKGKDGESKKGSKAARKRQKVQDQEAGSSNVKIKREDNSKAMVLYEPQVDMSSTALPFCSCTGVNRQCYRWGSGGWQSSCCTNSLSEYPLPMSSTKRGSRVAGRKMSGGAFKKLLEKQARDGVDITQPIDLKVHWAKHGTNRYIIVR
ncbi:hypothetical protein GOP47_0007939 [Adiantum capillus-veneris]|uniref:GAGA-binding transcriptional activator n=1 Tax=Adiantum capillus-veneris TaxID=13818 RepID=A0A9D4ZMG2_ADICA|nr:hypothetical protein GOP47_0007939 [Adiantum capillus-veneris]